jgi:predicted dehydrogenase
MTNTIGVGVIGMGFMGWRHADAYANAAAAGLPCEVVAVCDGDRTRCAAPASQGNIEGSSERKRPGWRSYTRVDELLNDDRVDLVSVCTPTESHVELAIRAIEAGKHVLVEKPVAVAAEQMKPLLVAARESSTLCMPAHCIRFWPGWDWLRDRVASGEFGRVRSATFLRSGAVPGWASFYADTARSGGVLRDFHIHDADFVRWVFGSPRSVCATGDDRHVSVLYRFDQDGPAHVTAEAGWTRAPTSGFRMRYTVSFDRATAEFEMGRDPTLLLSDERGSRAIDLPSGTGYDHEVAHLVRAIADNRRDLRVTMDDALATAQLLDATASSLRRGAWVDL